MEDYFLLSWLQEYNLYVIFHFYYLSCPITEKLHFNRTVPNIQHAQKYFNWCFHIYLAANEALK